MAIGAGDQISKYATQSSLGGSGAAITAGSFSVAGDLSTITIDEDVEELVVTLETNFTVAPDANSVVALFGATPCCRASVGLTVRSVMWSRRPPSIPRSSNPWVIS